MITGYSFIGSTRATAGTKTFQSYNAATGEALEPAFHSATSEDVEKALSLAASAFLPYSQTSPAERAKFLRTVAEKIDALGPEITPRMMAEAGLPEPRCEGERGRTVGQLKMFADLIDFQLGLEFWLHLVEHLVNHNVEA